MTLNQTDRSADNRGANDRRPKPGAVLIAVGVAIGAAVGIATDQVAVGVGLGTALGALTTFVVRRIQNRPPGGQAR